MLVDKDEYPDYMQSFPSEISEDLKQDLNRHIDMIIRANCNSVRQETQEDLEQPRVIVPEASPLESIEIYPDCQLVDIRVDTMHAEDEPRIISSSQSKGQRNSQPKQSSSQVSRPIVSMSPRLEQEETATFTQLKISSKLDGKRSSDINQPKIDQQPHRHSRNPSQSMRSTNQFRSVSRTTFRKPNHLASSMNISKKTIQQHVLQLKDTMQTSTTTHTSKSKEPYRSKRPYTGINSLAQSRGPSLQRLISPVSVKPLPTAQQILKERSKNFQPDMVKPIVSNSLKSSVISQDNKDKLANSVLFKDQTNRKSINPIMPGLLVPVRVRNQHRRTQIHQGQSKKYGSRIDFDTSVLQQHKKTAIVDKKEIENQPFRDKIMRSSSKTRVGGINRRY